MRRRETFDMFGHVPGNHRVHKLGRGLDNWRLDHIARVSTDTGLTKLHENCRFYALVEESNLIIDELLCRLVLL